MPCSAQNSSTAASLASRSNSPPRLGSTELERRTSRPGVARRRQPSTIRTIAAGHASAATSSTSRTSSVTGPILSHAPAERRDRSVLGAGAPAGGLGAGLATLRLEAPADRGPGRARRGPRPAGPGGRVAPFGQASQRRLAVPELRPFGGGNDPDLVAEGPPDAFGRLRRGSFELCEVCDELHPAVGGVHPLPAGAGAPGEPPGHGVR